MLRTSSLVGLLALALSVSALACTGETSDGSVAAESAVHLSPASGLTTERLKGELASAVDGLEYMSEADYPFDVLVAPGAVGAPVDADAIKAAFDGMPGASNSNEGSAGLALEALPGSAIHEFEEWMSSDPGNVDESDPDAVKYAKGMARAHDLMKANLTDLKVVLLAEESLENTEDVGFLHCFIVGRAADGSLVALHTGLVWT